MIVQFNGKEYRRNARNETALKYLCLDIFKYYLSLKNNLSIQDIQNTFNKWHCNNNYVVLSKEEWENKTEDLKKRYFSPIIYNSQDIYFTTQWGNNGGDCDNINNMISFATEKGYDIRIIQNEIISQKNEEEQKNNFKVKNIILYGAPGVGKTHNYQELISMIEEGKSQKDIFNTIKNSTEAITQNQDTYLKIKDEKRVEFVTFHQSYSYEDFIEGFRPQESKEGKIELEPGIFKTISDKAKENLENSLKSKKEIINDVNFEALLSEFILYLQEYLTRDEKFVLRDKALISDVSNTSFSLGGSVSSVQKLTFDILRRDYEDFKNGIIESYRDVRPTRESKAVSHGNALYYFALYQKIKEFEDNQYSVVEKSNIKEVKQKNHYIVIDEINRGNISKIFGELITLIEEDKRYDGVTANYDITLPYSKEPFKVPSNLYIIATMNSTDKSIATVDIALRRRFTFLKMEPKPELVKYLDAKELMIKLNEHIEKTLGEDYRLGHSYFMKVTDADNLEFVKEYKIKPLLEEYFYADDDNYKKSIDILGIFDE